MPLCKTVSLCVTPYSTLFSPFSDCSGALDVFVRPRLAQLTARRLSRKHAVRLMRVEREGGRSKGEPRGEGVVYRGGGRRRRHRWRSYVPKPPLVDRPICVRCMRVRACVSVQRSTDERERARKH